MATKFGPWEEPALTGFPSSEPSLRIIFLNIAIFEVLELVKCWNAEQFEKLIGHFGTLFFFLFLIDQPLVRGGVMWK